MSYINYITTEEELNRFSPRVGGDFSLELMTKDEMIQAFVAKTAQRE